MQFAPTDLLRQELSSRHLKPLLRSAGGFPERHGLSTHALRKLLNRMKGMRVAVIGDIIIDDYITCDPLGMSQEDPTIVVTPMETQTFIGGAGIVAAHAQGLGASTNLFTAFGADDTAAYARRTLSEMNVEIHAIVDETRPTTRKQRYRALNKTLLRVNHLRQHDISRPLARQMFDEVTAVLPRTDLLIFADFNYGCLPQELVDEIASAARKQGVVMAADSQASSQMSDITRFKGMSLVTPTEREARLAMRDTKSGLAILAAALRAAAHAENVLITLGADGMMVHGQSNHDQKYMTDRLPALNDAPKDVAGGGDSLLTSSAMALSAGSDIWLAAHLGSIAAALQVARLGNVPLKSGEIICELDQIDDQ
jgi:rfaE bifunctional protein kinase chain/domain